MASSSADGDVSSAASNDKFASMQDFHEYNTTRAIKKINLRKFNKTHGLVKSWMENSE